MLNLLFTKEHELSLGLRKKTTSVHRHLQQSVGCSAGDARFEWRLTSIDGCNLNKLMGDSLLGIAKKMEFVAPKI